MLNLFNLFKRKESIGKIEFENEEYDINTFFRFPEIIIRKYILPGKNLPEKELRKYSIKQVKANNKIDCLAMSTNRKHYLWGQEITPNTKQKSMLKLFARSHFLDYVKSQDRTYIGHIEGDNNLTLYYEDIPLCHIDYLTTRDSIYVKQIQSFQSSCGNYFKMKRLDFYDLKKEKNNFYIANFNWKKVLVQFLEIYSNVLNKNIITIQSTQNNLWTYKDKNYYSQSVYVSDEALKNSYLPKERALEIYDKTAIELGYEKDKKGNFSKVLR